MYGLVHSLSIAAWGMMPAVLAATSRSSELLFEIEIKTRIPDYDAHPTPQEYERRYRRRDDKQKQARIVTNLG